MNSNSIFSYKLERRYLAGGGVIGSHCSGIAAGPLQRGTHKSHIDPNEQLGGKSWVLHQSAGGPGHKGNPLEPLQLYFTIWQCVQK